MFIRDGASLGLAEALELFFFNAGKSSTEPVELCGDGVHEDTSPPALSKDIPSHTRGPTLKLNHNCKTAHGIHVRLKLAKCMMMMMLMMWMMMMVMLMLDDDVDDDDDDDDV